MMNVYFTQMQNETCQNYIWIRLNAAVYVLVIFGFGCRFNDSTYNDTLFNNEF